MNYSTEISGRAGDPPQPITKHRFFTRASKLKPKIAGFVASDTAGQIIGFLSGKRVRHQGLWFDVRSKDFSPRVRAQMFWGIYEGAETRMIRQLLQGSKAVVELGSSLGVTTCHIAEAMAPGGHLVCVEANPNLGKGLSKRISPYSASLHIDMIHAAVTDRSGTANFTLSSETFSSRIGPPRKHEITVEVPALTLRQILRETQVTTFDLVADVEGAEATFLIKDPDSLAQCKRAIIELHDSTISGVNTTISDLRSAALRAGFQIIRSHGSVVVLVRP